MAVAIAGDLPQRARARGIEAGILLFVGECRTLHYGDRKGQLQS